MKIIEFQSVGKSYGVRDVTLSIESGERVAILGPSGCGKTTLLRLTAGFIAPDVGKILIDGTLVASDGRNLKEPEERNLGMVFQDLALWPHLTVSGNLEFGLEAKGVPAAERKQRIDEMLRLVRMESLSNARPTELSGGQQQRVALARALVLQPKALLMDEPLSSLDTELRASLCQEILGLHGRLGFTLLYVTHDRQEAFEMAMRRVFMEQGTITAIR